MCGLMRFVEVIGDGKDLENSVLGRSKCKLGYTA
jgi:hypothetical protein